MGWGDVRYCFAMAILVIILITSPDCCRVMYRYSTFLFHYCYYLVLLFLLLLLFFHTFLSTLFLGDALIKLYETL
jgi:hypothetical protein